MISSDIRAIWPGALLVVYLGATTVLLLAGRDRVSAGSIVLHVAALAAIATATWSRLVPRWLRDWTPLLALLFLYTEMPALIRAAGHDRMLDPLVVGWEHALFGMQPAKEWARTWPQPFLSEILHFAYLSYYPIIFSVPALLYAIGRRDEFHVAVFVLMLTFVACFTCYVVFPVVGPRYIWPSPSPRGLFQSAASWLLDARSSAGTAFPSSHVAVATTQSVLAMRFIPRWGVLVPLFSTGLAMGAVYGGFHYAVDVLAGIALALLIAPIGLMAARRSLPAQAKAIAPT